MGLWANREVRLPACSQLPKEYGLGIEDVKEAFGASGFSNQPFLSG